MIPIIPTLLTPAMLAICPPMTPAPATSFDWATQRAVASASAGAHNVPYSMNGTTSMNPGGGGGFIIDDYNSD